jgi:hypothetical protein
LCVAAELKRQQTLMDKAAERAETDFPKALVTKRSSENSVG